MKNVVEQSGILNQFAEEITRNKEKKKVRILETETMLYHGVSEEQRLCINAWS